MAYYLGIDGGGSKTRCAVGDESSLLATVAAGPSNVTRVGEARARESLHQAIREACAAGKIDPGQLRRACIGAAGAGREEIASVVRRIVAEVIPGEIEIVGDMQIALEAAFGAGPGVIVIAGTGSIAYGRDAKGRTARAGGWGFAISDEGSAHWIGREAVSALLRAADQAGGDRLKSVQGQDARIEPEASTLFNELKTAWKLGSLDRLVRTANSTPDFAALFPAVLSAAGAGDTVAQFVLAQAGTELAQLAGIVLRRLFPEQLSSASSVVHLAMVGGVFRHALGVRELFYNEIRSVYPNVVLNLDVIEPVHGALQRARRTTS
ncbi:MAG: BadF/BadG/BcrA/BcrD ATPase family protein [Candidatus Sulfotelmatobacter sp.]